MQIWGLCPEFFKWLDSAELLDDEYEAGKANSPEYLKMLIKILDDRGHMEEFRATMSADDLLQLEGLERLLLDQLRENMTDVENIIHGVSSQLEAEFGPAVGPGLGCTISALSLHVVGPHGALELILCCSILLLPFLC